MIFHAVSGIFPTQNNIPVYDNSPLFYKCRACQFRGNLSAAVEHVVKNQFVVKDDPKPQIRKES